jgi:Protein of unknown function (DUF1579)
MKATWTTYTASMVFAAVLGLQAWANDELSIPSPKEFAKAMADASQPGPEHAKLEPLVGKWKSTCKFWMDPSQPPVETEGTIERRWILGKRFLEEKIEGTNFDGQPGFEALGVIGYDNAKKKYTSSWFCSMGTGTCTGFGTSDAPDTFTFQTEAYCPMMKKTIKGREELRFKSDDKTIAESYILDNGREVKIMEIVAVRQK